MKRAVIFDLDGVIVSTDEYHYLAWKKVADEAGILFDRTTNERLRGVSRMESLEIILRKSSKIYTDVEKNEMAARKNMYYRELLNRLSPADILPGVKHVLEELKKLNIRMAIGSSSRNTLLILERIRLGDFFDAVADGNAIKQGKPDPEVFLLAAAMLDIEPQDCVVVEDAQAGIDAAVAAGMKAVGVFYASDYPKAHMSVKDMNHIHIRKMLE